MTALLLLFVVAAVPLLPTEAVLIGSGVLVASGELSLLAVIPVATAGCFLADLVNYALGRGAGSRAVERVSRRAGARAVVEWTRAKLATRGEPILVAVRWAPGGGVVGALIAGSVRWPLRRFVPVAFIGSALWCTYTALIGYFGGQVVAEPVLAIALSWGAALLVSLPVGLAVRAAQRRVVTPAG
ncbi:DedA family protein [Actinosynnema sp. NPDC047251]|uniref:Putative membrane protein n=1 Tax=Saccharothrix espanaensis (strain ATCC 51144 / DSM 44229 / JCM 9112 / NBRC 15066 / NRRL 15764) TaxID=1179773 RepID=K0JQY0_SACES|nr:DedA family protein [Saccharothrix espanaensis]CCH27582.1 putative membrane protein [Saccharothrix espanaensis DSM 44229]